MTAAAGSDRAGIDWSAIRAIVNRDLTAVRRARAVIIPMLAVPVLLLVVLPLLIGVAARRASTSGGAFISSLPAPLADQLLVLDPDERLLTLVLGYLLAPLFLIVPLMVSAVLAADGFAGEKERRTLETLLHLPVADRDLFLAKLAAAFLPALAVSWAGFAAFCLVANAVAWPVLGRLLVPNSLWLVVILWVAPAVAALGLGIMVRVSARARTSQEANQLGGAVILPLIFVAVGQATGLLLVDLEVAIAIGAVVWLAAIWLVVRGATRFTRDAMVAQS